MGLLFFDGIPDNRWKEDRVTKTRIICGHLELKEPGGTEIKIDGRMMPLESRLLEILCSENEARIYVTSLMNMIR